MKKINIKLLILLTIPIFIELLLQILAGNVDKIMVKNDVLATAINQANSILDLLVVSLSVLSAASLILINQYKGAKEIEKEKIVYKISFYFNLLVGIIISIILAFFAKPLLMAMQVTKDVLPHAVIYLRITGGAVFLQAMMLSLASYLRSNELMVHSLVISVIFNLFNILLNALFLYALNLPGTVGVALGSTISRFVGVILLFIVCKTKIKLNLGIKGLFPLKKAELKKIINIGLPACGESISYSLSQIVIVSFINIIGVSISVAAPAAKTYASMLAYITYLFVNAASQGMQILLGRYLGSNERELAKKLVWNTTIVSLVVSIIFACLLAFNGKWIFSLLTSDQDVVDLCCKIMYVEIALEIGRAINIVMVRALQTSGDVMFPTISAVAFCWLVATLGSYILGIVFELGIIGVWISMAFDEIIRAIIFIFRFKSDKWMKKDLVN
ncbi:MAG: MATE family efflux transporter [Anaeroplasma sp.]